MGDKRNHVQGGTCKRARKAEKNSRKKYCDTLDKQVEGKTSRE